VWSGFTAVSGLVRNSLDLAIARVGVGIGEAAGAAPAHSLISDYFPAAKRATALSIFQGGVYLGSMLGLIIGGYLAGPVGWRNTFIIVGVPGLLIALLVRFTVRDPVRGGFDPNVAPTDGATLGEVLRHLAKLPTFWLVALGAGIASFAGTGLGMWMPTFLERVHEMPKTEIGWRFGVIQYGTAFFGAILCGRVADVLGKRDVRWYAGVGALSVLSMLPFISAQLLWPTGEGAIWWSVPSALTGAGWAPIAYSMAQNIVPPHMRAVASSIIILFITFLGTGLGPLAVGFLNDVYEPHYGVEAVRWSLLTMISTCAFGALLFGLAVRTIRRDFGQDSAQAPEQDAASH